MNDVINEGYHIYLHEEEQLWPSKKDDQTGQTDPIFLPVGIDLEGSFTLTQKTSLNKRSSPCTNDPGYSFSSCIRKYIATLVGCELDWFIQTKSTNFPACSTRNHIIEFQNQAQRLHQASWHNLTSESGCQVKCTILEYHFKRNKEESVTWKQEWSSAFYLHAETTKERQEEEYWVFDANDALNGIGGALGLFLGWSILYILQNILSMCQKIYDQCTMGQIAGSEGIE